MLEQRLTVVSTPLVPSTIVNVLYVFLRTNKYIVKHILNGKKRKKIAQTRKYILHREGEGGGWWLKSNTLEVTGNKILQTVQTLR